jgi:hypothetical protein
LTSAIQRLLIGLTLLASLPGAAVQDALPVFKGGAAPTYPPIARIARIEGPVRLRVTTDGEKVSAVTVIAGQPMLAKEAEGFVRGWSFEHHEPFAFEISVLYRLVNRDCAEPATKVTVKGNLPSQVEITAFQRGYCEADYVDLSEPLRVFFTGCELDDKPISCDGMSVDLAGSNQRFVPKRFKEPDGREGFIVPGEMRALKEFGVAIKLGSNGFAIPSLDGSFLKGTWRIGIRHNKRWFAKNRCTGYVLFEWLEPGRVVSTPCR